MQRGLYVGLFHVCVAARNARVDRACSVAMMPGPGDVAFLRDPPWPRLSARLLSTVPLVYDLFPMRLFSMMQVDARTALHMAAENGHTDIVKALLAAGANVSATAVRGLVSRVCGGLRRTQCIGLFVWQ
jgi:hypothetical protein